MKAILVIDEMPTRCLGCPCYYEDRGRCQKTWESVEDEFARPSWCPLKPMPQKKNTDMRLSAMDEWLEHSERIGFNKCIDEILGEE